MNKNEEKYIKYIGKRIREIRIKVLQKSLRQFSLECEVPIATLSRIENGTREAGFVTMKKIAEGFGYSYSDFINNIEKSLPDKFSIYEK